MSGPDLAAEAKSEKPGTRPGSQSVGSLDAQSPPVFGIDRSTLSISP